MIKIVKLTQSDITPTMLINFKHKQQIKKKWIRNGEVWQSRNNCGFCRYGK